MRGALLLAGLLGLIGIAESRDSLRIHSYEPTPTGQLRNASAELRWSVWSEPSRLPEVELWLDDQPIAAEYEPVGRQVRAVSPPPLRPGRHNVRCELRFGSFEPYRKEWSFELVASPSGPLAHAGNLDVLRLVNLLREDHGLQPIGYLAELLASTRDHANYLRRHAVLAHEQAPGSAGFTGKRPIDRARTYGLDQAVGEVIARQAKDPVVAIRALFDAPYHRPMFLDPEATGVGYGGDGPYHVLDAAFRRERGGVVLSPHDGAVDVPALWAANEEPNPLRGTGLQLPVGYIVMLLCYGQRGDRFEMVEADLLGPHGTRVPTYARHPGNDPEMTRPNGVMLIPNRPLDGETTYRARVSYRLNGGPIQRADWSFTTMPNLF